MEHKLSTNISGKIVPSDGMVEAAADALRDFIAGDGCLTESDANGTFFGAARAALDAAFSSSFNSGDGTRR